MIHDTLNIVSSERIPLQVIEHVLYRAIIGKSIQQLANSLFRLHSAPRYQVP